MTNQDRIKFNVFVVTLIVLFIIGCHNYQNEMMLWSAEIPKGATVNEVRVSQPDFLSIDWENGDTFELATRRYPITKIEGNNDFLQMGYYLEFDSIGYRGLFGHK
ncbi:MAG: hypothetical protein ACI8SE_001654 [Bacteroidia bacterium]|jgi:hypothetical protein